MRNSAKKFYPTQAKILAFLCVIGLPASLRGVDPAASHAITFTADDVAASGDPQTVVQNAPVVQAFSAMATALTNARVPEEKIREILTAMRTDIGRLIDSNGDPTTLKEKLQAAGLNTEAQTAFITQARNFINADPNSAIATLNRALETNPNQPDTRPVLERGRAIIQELASRPRPSGAPTPGPSGAPTPGQTPRPSAGPNPNPSSNPNANNNQPNRTPTPSLTPEQQAALAAQAAQQAAAAQAAQQGQGGGGAGGGGAGGGGAGGGGGGKGGENGAGNKNDAGKTPSFKETHDKLNPDGNNNKGPNLSELRGLLGDDKNKDNNKKKDDFSLGGSSGRAAKDESKPEEKKSSLADLLKQKQEEQNAIDPTAGKVGPVKQEYNGPTSVPQVIGYYGGGGSVDPSAFGGGSSGSGSAIDALQNSNIKGVGAGGTGGANSNGGGDPFSSVGKTKFTPPEGGLKRLSVEFGGEDPGFETGVSNEGEGESTRRKDPKGTALINELVFSDNLEEIRGRGIFGLVSRLSKWCRGSQGKEIGVCQKAFTIQQVLTSSQTRGKGQPSLVEKLEVNKAILKR